MSNISLWYGWSLKTLDVMKLKHKNHFIFPTTINYSSAKGEKRNVKDKDRYSVISRPYQKLPPPFEYHEHHKMQGHTTVPVAIYEKEPTSIIAYALSSREYAAELKVLTDKTLAKHLPSVVGLGGVAEVKAPVASPGV